MNQNFSADSRIYWTYKMEARTMHPTCLKFSVITDFQKIYIFCKHIFCTVITTRCWKSTFTFSLAAITEASTKFPKIHETPQNSKHHHTNYTRCMGDPRPRIYVPLNSEITAVK